MLQWTTESQDYHFPKGGTVNSSFGDISSGLSAIGTTPRKTGLAGGESLAPREFGNGIGSGGGYARCEVDVDANGDDDLGMELAPNAGDLVGLGGVFNTVGGDLVASRDGGSLTLIEGVWRAWNVVKASDRLSSCNVNTNVKMVSFRRERLTYGCPNLVNGFSPTVKTRSQP